MNFLYMPLAAVSHVAVRLTALRHTKVRKGHLFYL